MPPSPGRPNADSRPQDAAGSGTLRAGDEHVVLFELLADEGADHQRVERGVEGAERDPR
jgi:hypothetical protein